MSAYVILELSIHDLQTMDEYRKLGAASVEAYGGKFIVRGGKTTSLEGGWEPRRIVMIEFSSHERAQEWWSSEAYTRARAVRESAADTKMIIVDGV